MHVQYMYNQHNSTTVVGAGSNRGSPFIATMNFSMHYHKVIAFWKVIVDNAVGFVDTQAHTEAHNYNH